MSDKTRINVRMTKDQLKTILNVFNNAAPYNSMSIQAKEYENDFQDALRMLNKNATMEEQIIKWLVDNGRYYYNTADLFIDLLKVKRFDVPTNNLGHADLPDHIEEIAYNAVYNS